jgi:large subunit ribosomal protein L4
MELVMRRIDSDKSGKVQVSERVFGQDFNEALVHQVLTAYRAGARSGSKQQKTRSEVRGGGRKPWKQKGLGRARVGSIRSPIWRGGGVTFAARPRSFRQKVNQKMYRGALRSIFSELARQGRLSCVEEFAIEKPKTKLAVDILGRFGLAEALIITDAVSTPTYYATRNLPKVSVIDTSEIEPYSLIGFEHVMLSKSALAKVEAWLA